MRKILILIFLFFVCIPSVNAETVGEGYPSRIPIFNNSIEQDFFFDGANYEMITPYGNYVWLQPNNIMEYWDLDGDEVIDKSVWVLQHNTSGMWLSLLDFDNQRISLVNETFYEIAYDVKFKEKGPSRIVGSVEIGFYSSGYSMNEPQIIVNFTKGSGWNDLGMGSFRWLWDIVPKGSWTKYVNETSKTNTDILNYEVTGKSSKIYFSKISEYSDLEKWIVLDISDYGSVDFRGGDESFFNTRGFIIIFPENEGYIDPVTIANGFDASSTAIEQQRKVFKNPRGLEYYYALFEGGNQRYFLYNSTDGVTWNRVYDIDVLGGDYILSARPPDMTFFEDASNNRLILLVTPVSQSGGDDYLLLHAIEIKDTGVVDHLFTGAIAVSSDDGVYNPNIEIDDDGYIWVSWTDEFTKKGKQRNQLRVTRTVTTYPLIAPFWEAIVNVYGEDGSGEHGDGLDSITLESELIAISATGNMTVIFNFYDSSGVPDYYGLVGITLTAPAGVITESALSNLVKYITVIDTYDYLVSCVSESGGDSDVFILHGWTGAPIAIDMDLLKLDISANLIVIYGEVFNVADAGDSVQSLSLSINQTANPDMLICLWSNTTAGSLWSESTEVDLFSLEVLFEVDGEVQAVDYFSSSGIDESGEVYLIYTMANNTVRFYNVELPPDIIIPDAPELLFGAGFNGSDGFVLIFWNHTLVNYTDFEVHNSSDGVVFTFLNNVSLPWFNHTGLTNMTYIYYRVRARSFMPFFNQYFNSSWSDVNLEKVYFERAGGAGAVNRPTMLIIVGLLTVCAAVFIGVKKR